LVERSAFGGDDGLVPDMADSAILRAATGTGLTIKAESVAFGKMGIQFLARTYGPDVWNGDPNSMCDLPRQLSKFHLSTPLPNNVTPAEKLLEKARGYIHSDGQTPIIGPYINAIVFWGSTRPVSTYASVLRNYMGFTAKDIHYPNFLAQWMIDEAYRVLPNANPSRLANFTQRATSLEQLLNPPSIMGENDVIPVTQAVVVDGISREPILEQPPSRIKPKHKLRPPPLRAADAPTTWPRAPPLPTPPMLIPKTVVDPTTVPLPPTPSPSYSEQMRAIGWGEEEETCARPLVTSPNSPVDHSVSLGTTSVIKKRKSPSTRAHSDARKASAKQNQPKPSAHRNVASATTHNVRHSKG
jgi:hypothetical protein